MTIYVLFGEMGIGKNYVGERLASHLDCEFFDGDLIVPPKMVQKVVNFRPLSFDDVHDYVHKHLIPGIDNLILPGQDLVVAQALYRQEHREAIVERLYKHKVELVYIPVLDRKTHIRRLYSRENGWKWAAYGLFNSLFFEEPPTNVLKVRNEEGVDDLSFQFDLIERGF